MKCATYRPRASKSKPSKSLEPPKWYNPKGSKISCLGYDLRGPVGKIILLGSKTGLVNIQIYLNANRQYWVVKYEIRHRSGSVNIGRVEMSETDLRTAFRLSDKRKNHRIAGNKFPKNHAHFVCCPGKYIRFGEYLNIPGKGTGSDEDSRVSICVTRNISNRMNRMLLD